MSVKAPAVVGPATVVVDSADPPALGHWWSTLLGGQPLTDHDGDVWVHTDHGVTLLFARVPETKSGKNRLHLDLPTSDLDGAVEQALALGATTGDDVFRGPRWRVMRDPEGNEFCLIAPRD